MIVARPVQYTSDMHGYRALFAALGLVELPPDHAGDGTADWAVFQAGSGRVGLHAVEPGDPLDGGAALGFETDDLDGAAARLMAVCTVRRFGRSGGRAVEATATDGLALVLLAPTAGVVRADVSELASLGLWMTPQIGAAVAVLRALGLRGEVRSESGQWFQARADGGGLSAVHDAEVARAELSLEFDGDLVVLQQRLDATGIGCSLVDESYGRTLLVDRPGGGEPLWINEKQSDLYGYVAL